MTITVGGQKDMREILIARLVQYSLRWFMGIIIITGSFLVYILPQGLLAQFLLLKTGLNGILWSPFCQFRVYYPHKDEVEVKN